jgi:glycine/D-amino acid oxidase-like deaminating enzyme
MHVAIIGAGLAGLGLAWHLLEKNMQVTLFDPQGIGWGASGVSTGLLHPFPGKWAEPSWEAMEGMKATKQLLRVSEEALRRPVAEYSGLFRAAVTEEQKTIFQLRAQSCREAIWQDHPFFGLGLWIPSGITVYSKLYLDGLWLACKGATLRREKIDSLSQLAGFDHIVIAAGFESCLFEECKDLPLKATKGQTLLCKWERRVPFSLSSSGHISPTENSKMCQVGSTYEREFDHHFPDERGLYLIEKIAPFYPDASRLEVVEQRAGIRISPQQGHRPFIQRVTKNRWVFTGLGSRGLLYHALLVKRLAEMIERSCDG